MHAQHSISASQAATSTKAEDIPAAFKNFDSLPDSAFVRLPVVVLLDSSSPATIWRKIRKGTFPASVKLGENSTCWNVGALRRHYNAIMGSANHAPA